MRIVEQLNAQLHALMARRDDILFLGEDVLDPYGGAFKVAKGLSTAFPDRVITTPISEASIVGFGTGLALQGFRPIVEIMFGDFSTLIADQLINQAGKMTWMYGRDLDVPLVVRTPMGGGRGYGPTHSQSLEKHFLGVPGLSVLAVSPVFDAGELLRIAVEDIHTPVLFAENKLLYAAQQLTPGEMNVQHSDALVPTVTWSHAEPDVTVVTYGHSVRMVLDIVKTMHREEELNFSVVVPHQLSALDAEPIRKSLRSTRRLVVVEEGVGEHGWGAEVLAAVSDVRLEAPPVRVAGKNLPIPAARSLEDRVLPQENDIVDAVLQTIDTPYT